MRWTEQQKRRAYQRTQGLCHLCHHPVRYSAFGTRQTDGWQMDHSRPQNDDGSDHGNNLYPAHWDCNAAKRDRNNRYVRSRYGVKRAPLSARAEGKARTSQAVVGGVLGTLGGVVLEFALPGASLLGAAAAYLVNPRERPSRPRNKH